MWPSQYSSCALVLVLEGGDAASCTALLERFLVSAQTLIDFAPPAAAPSSSVSDAEVPAAAIFCVAPSGAVSCLFSASQVLQQQLDVAAEERSSSRSGARLRESVRDQLAKIVAASLAACRQADATETTTQAVLASLVKCTGELLRSRSPACSALPSLIRIFCSRQQQLASAETTEADGGGASPSERCKDSVCALMSAWQQNNIRVTLEGSDDGAAASPPINALLRYLLSVGNTSSLSTPDAAGAAASRLVFVCPRCRTMIFPPASAGSALRVLAMQEPPLCPNGCRA